MKKIGIITITGLSNYGNRLQNYALQQTIETLFNCRCETFVNKSYSLKGYISRILRPEKKELSEREMLFQHFNDEYVNFSNIQINNLRKDRRLLEYDCLICGSDQIWNSDYPENDRANFGYFYRDQKVISYAASFGTDTVLPTKRKKYARYLKHLKAISVREERGRELASALSGRDDVNIHVDPTMLLSSEQWTELEKPPAMFHGGKYILKYFLGGKNEAFEAELEQYARGNKLLIIDAISANSPYYTIGPSEFLYLEHHAELVVTDSFHACVFAILYERPFIVASRKATRHQSMGSRIDTLLDRFCLQNRKYRSGCLEEMLRETIPYTDVKRTLEQEKEKSSHYLKESI